MAGTFCFTRPSFILFCVIGVGIILFSLFSQPLRQRRVENYPPISKPVVRIREPLTLPDDHPNMPPYRIADTWYRDDFPRYRDTVVPAFNTHTHTAAVPAFEGNGDLHTKMGVVIHDTNEEYRLPLYGRRDDFRGAYFNYYVIDHTSHHNKIELEDSDYLNNGDTIHVPGYPGNFTVHMYTTDYARFRPNIRVPYH